MSICGELGDFNLWFGIGQCKIVAGDFDVQPVVVRVVSRNRKCEVVGGDGGSDAGTVVTWTAVESEDAEVAAELGMAEGCGLGFA